MKSCTRQPFLITTETAGIDVDAVHDYLCQQSYWATGRSRKILERSIQNSLNFGLFDRKRQIGFASVVADPANFGYLADVFVLPASYGHGIAKWLLNCVVFHPDLRGLNRLILETSNGQRPYKQFDFQALVAPGDWMERRKVPSIRICNES